MYFSPSQVQGRPETFPWTAGKELVHNITRFIVQRSVFTVKQ